MRRGWAWFAFGFTGICLLGSVAWPLWSGNPGWSIGFGVLCVVVVLPVVFAGPARAVWFAFTDPSRIGSLDDEAD